MQMFYSMVQMCTIQPWSILAPSNTNSREVVQLDATIGAVFGKHSTIQLLKAVGKILLGTLGRDKAET